MSTDIPKSTSLQDHHTDLFEEFFGNKSQSASSEGTRRTDLRDWLDWCESEDIDAREVSEADMHSYIDDRKKQMSTQSLVSRFNSASIFYVFLASRDEIQIDNPCEGIDLKKEHDVNPSQTRQIKVIVKKRRTTEDKKQLLALQTEDVESVLKHMPEPSIRNEAAARLMWECGLRPVEVQRLRVGDVDLEARHITVDSAKINDTNDDDYFRDQWWSSDSRLDVLLYRWIEEERPRLVDDDDDDNEDEGKLFLTSHSDKLRSMYLSRKVNEAAREAGVNEVLYTDAGGDPRWLVSGHTMRISYITHMANQTPTPIPIIAELAGHKKVQTTFEYVHSDPETLKTNQQKFGP